MALAIVLGVLGFLAAIFLTVFAAYGLLDAAGVWGALPMGAACALVAVCGVVRGPLRYGEQLCNHYLAFKILALVRDKVFGKMRTLAPAKLEGRDKGDLVSLLTGDIELLEVFYAHTLSPAAIALVVSVVMVAFTATLSPLLALYAAFSYAVVGIAVPWISSKASGTGGREVRDAIGSMNAFVLDSLRGLRETLQFGRADDRAHELACRMSSLAGGRPPEGSHGGGHGGDGCGGIRARYGHAACVNAPGELRHARFRMRRCGVRGAHVVVRAGYRRGEFGLHVAANARIGRTRARCAR